MTKNLAFWVGIGVAAIFAVVFHVAVTRPKAKLHRNQREELKSRQQELTNLQQRGRREGGIPGPQWIESTASYVSGVQQEILACEKLVVRQRRQNHTRRFYENPGTPFQKPITSVVAWVKRYWEECEALRAQFRATYGDRGFPFRSWAPNLPTNAQIDAAQTEFWFLKDIVDLLTNQHEKDLTQLLKDDEQFPSIFELVQNPVPKGIEEFLAKQERDVLFAILQDILINKEGNDLIQIFQKRNLWEPLAGMMFAENQRKFMSRLASEDVDRADLVDFLMDLRTVRYLSDLRDLCDQHQQKELSLLLKEYKENPGPVMESRILTLISPWDKARLAQVIAFLISISDKEDFRIILRNHRLELAGVDDFSVITGGVRTTGPETPGAEPTAGPAPAPEAFSTAASARESFFVSGVPGLYDTVSFRLKVRIEFQAIPILIRRLTGTDWRVEILHLSIDKAGVSEGSPIRPVVTPSTTYSPEEPPPAGAPPVAPEAPPTRSLTETERQEREVTSILAPKELVSVTLECSAKHFLPLQKKIEAESASAQPK